MLIISVRDNENNRRKRNGEKKMEKNKGVMLAILKGGELKSNLKLVLSIILKERELCIREFVY